MQQLSFFKKISSLILLLCIPFIADSQDISNALKVGDKAPDFVLKNSHGKQVKLSSLLAKGKVILTWYRGGWCPYCNKALSQLQEILPQIKEQGATVVALTPELPDYSSGTINKNKLQFEILSDIDNKIAEIYGLKFTLDQKTATFYESKMNLSKVNGNNLSQLPVPATYIIDRKGIIRFAYLNPNYKERVNPTELIKELKKIK